MNMKENSNHNASHSGPGPQRCTSNPLTVVTLDQMTESAHPECNMIYRCKNCGRPLSSYDIINFYGLPACPVCFNAAAPFEVELLPSATQTASMHS